ncbi:hypothetical protein CRUP_009271 [Coryphaenoides rupestris]|nr:hypothetical protein CRUP_009271 [Coryphaenoides rupestris]
MYWSSERDNMSVFMDLNVPFTADKKRLKTLLETAAHLGFSTVAINYVHLPQAKGKKEIPQPTPLSHLVDELPIVQTACMTFDVDIICITVTERLPFFFKRAPVNGARERGVAFEVCYSAAIRDSTIRRYTLTNTMELVERCAGKNIIISSGTDKPLELRGPYDIANLAQVFGMSEVNAKDSVSSNCRSVLLHAETRKTACGVIYTMKSKDSQPEAINTVSTASDGPPQAKKLKTTAS